MAKDKQMKKSVFQFEERSLSFNDVAIYQQKNKAKSRMDVDISSEIIRGVVRPNPLIAANMSTVVNAEFYKQLYSLGGMAFLHRAQSIEDQIAEIKEVAKHCEWVGFSIGVGQDYKKNVSRMIKAGGNICLIDIAHGYSDEVINLGRWIKNKHPKVKVVVGNTNNTDMMDEVKDFADAVKVGIGGGKNCITSLTAGCTENQFTVIQRFAPISKKLGIPIISCGATRVPADLSKAIAGGANAIMIGSVFAATPESAAIMEYTLDGKFKEHSGMASLKVQQQWKGGLKDGTCAEGITILLPLGRPLKDVVQEYEGSLRSAITYSGALSVKEMQRRVKFVKL